MKNLTILLSSIVIFIAIAISATSISSKTLSSEPTRDEPNLLCKLTGIGCDDDKKEKEKE